MYLGLVAAPILFVIAFSYITRWDRGDDGVAPLVVGAITVASIVSARAAAHRPLLSRSSQELAGSYRTRMFVGIGLADIAVLGAVSLSFVLSNSLWLIAVGAVATEMGLWLVAPSRRNLAADQERLRQAGSSLDLVAALNTPPRPQDAPE
jgi:hypothetical protein